MNEQIYNWSSLSIVMVNRFRWRLGFGNDFTSAFRKHIWIQLRITFIKTYINMVRNE